MSESLGSACNSGICNGEVIFGIALDVTEVWIAAKCPASKNSFSLPPTPCRVLFNKTGDDDLVVASSSFG